MSSRKRKQPQQQQQQTNLLSPSVFLSSILKMNLFPKSFPIPEKNDKNTTMTTEMKESDDVTTSRAVSSSSIKSSNNCNGIKVTFDNDAIELLRKCHGEFLSLVSSELAYSERQTKKRQRSNKGNNNKIHNNDYHQETNNNIGADCDHHNTAILEEDVIRTISPKNVIEALHDLEFHDISQTLSNASKKKNNDVKETNGKIIDNDQTGGSNYKPQGNRKQGTKMKKKRIKNALKNVSMTAELLEEQERLFASSVAKAKSSLN